MAASQSMARAVARAASRAPDHRWIGPSTLVVLVILVASASAPRAQAGEPGGPPPLPSAIGIRVSVVDTRPDLLEADLDLTMYTRYPCSCSTSTPTAGIAGTPYFGIPALDYGDGSTLSTTALALASPGGGPAGTNVYRSLASFTHTYPAVGNYTVTAGMFCTYCFRGNYTVFPTGAPASPVFSTSTDLVPATVIGNLAARYSYAYSGPTFFSGPYSYRYNFTYYGAVTDTAEVDLTLPSVISVPTLSQWGLVSLAVSLLILGLAWLRRLGQGTADPM